jgi:hypothetical protein
VRLPKSLHIALSQRAKMEGVSMNLMFTAIISEVLGRAKARRNAPVTKRRSRQRVRVHQS